MKLLLLLSIISCALFSQVLGATSGTCLASITAIARSGATWTDGGLVHQIYDITASNTGSCGITSLFGFFAFPASGQVVEAWNYNKSTGEISNFGSSLQAGQTATAGFILAGTVTPTLAFSRAICPTSCIGSASSTGAAGSTGQPSATTGAVGSTGQPSSTTGASSTACGSTQCAANQVCVTAAPTGEPSCFYRLCSDLTCGAGQICLNNGGVARCVTVGGSCSVDITVKARPGGNFLLGGELNQIYDLDISNTGNQAVSSLVISITPAEGTRVVQDNKWNLVLWTEDRYNVSTYGALTAVSGTHYLGAGFVLAGARASTAAPAVFPYYVVC